MAQIMVRYFLHRFLYCQKWNRWQFTFHCNEEMYPWVFCSMWSRVPKQFFKINFYLFVYFMDHNHWVQAFFGPSWAKCHMQYKHITYFCPITARHHLNLGIKIYFYFWNLGIYTRHNLECSSTLNKFGCFTSHIFICWKNHFYEAITILKHLLYYKISWALIVGGGIEIEREVPYAWSETLAVYMLMKTSPPSKQLYKKKYINK